MTVRVEHDGPVTTIVLARSAAKNAIDRATADALAEAFRAFAEGDASVAVLFGEGGTFSAGADLHAFARGEGNRVNVDGDGPLGPTRMRMPKPLIAAIAGHAVAGGLELALLADLRIVEEDAVLGVYCRRFGVPLVDGGTVRLPRIVGLSRALDMILTGRAVGAAEAHAIGLADRVVPRGTSRAAAEALAHEIAAFPQRTMLGDRASVYDALDLPFADAIVHETTLGLAALATGEAEAGARAFVAGRGRHGTPR